MSINFVEQKLRETKRSEVESLIFLMEDPDPFVQDSVKQRLLDLGERCIPLLDEYQSGIRDKAKKESVLEIIRKIAFGSLEQEFVNYLENGVDDVHDLEKGMFILARLDNPTLRSKAYVRRLDRMASRVADDVKYATSRNAQMQIVLDYIFKEENFRGATSNYFNPENSFLNRVMDRKEGIPISLAMIVLFVASRLGLPFYGVNMPMHFLMKYEGDAGDVYLDPFNGGSVVSVDQCAYFLKKSGLQPVKEHFTAASGSQMLARTIRNLINCFQKNNDVHRTKELRVLLGLVETMYPDL